MELQNKTKKLILYFVTIPKIGSGILRKALYMPAIVAKKHNPAINRFCTRLQLKGKHNMSIIAAAMRKLLHIIYGILKSGNTFQENLHL